MSVQSRRKPSKLFTATVYGFIWSGLLVLMICCVWGTILEIQIRSGGDKSGFFRGAYLCTLLYLVVLVFCGVGVADGSKRLAGTVQLLFLSLFSLVFYYVLLSAGNLGGRGTAYFLGDPAPGIVSTYEAFGIWALFVLGALLLIFAVADGEYRSELWTGIGGILIVIGILMPKVLDSYALLQATCHEFATESFIYQEPVSNRSN